jgi:hypothetical protein
MKHLVHLVIAFALAALAGCHARSPQEDPVDMTIVKADLQTVARARVLFAHQSVGRNVIDGVQALAVQAGVPLRIREIDGAPPDAEPGLFHTLVGTNGDGASKVAVFAGLVDRPERPAYDVAVLKFCYEDLARDAKGRTGLLERYAARVGALQQSRPDVRVLHVTSPLRADPPGWKTRLKRLLGKPTEEDADNVARNAYNSALRARYATASVFDIAAVESTRTDGSRSSFAAPAGPVYTLAQEFTSDGGHLNENGRRLAGAAFLHSLALALKGQGNATRLP